MVQGRRAADARRPRLFDDAQFTGDFDRLCRRKQTVHHDRAVARKRDGVGDHLRATGEPGAVVSQPVNMRGRCVDRAIEPGRGVAVEPVTDAGCGAASEEQHAVIRAGCRRGQVDRGGAGVVFYMASDVDIISNTTVSVEDGAYEFLLGTDTTGMIAAGSYLLVSGSDPDNDSFICDIAEACGFFRSIDLPEEIAVNGDLVDLDFNVTYLLPIEQNSAQSSIMSSIRARGGIRLPRAKAVLMASDDDPGN